jgi:hypothetical protein
VSGLTGQDRYIIAKAREMTAGPHGVDKWRERYGDTDSTMALASAVGEAQFLLTELVAIIERPAAPEDTRRLGEIRAVLARFDWEHDDRQLALEAIERIATQEGETDAR